MPLHDTTITSAGGAEEVVTLTLPRYKVRITHLELNVSVSKWIYMHGYIRALSGITIATVVGIGVPNPGSGCVLARQCNIVVESGGSIRAIFRGTSSGELCRINAAVEKV